MTQTLSGSLTSLIQKYNLDISIVDLKQVEGRLDAEFFKPEYLAGNSSILNHKFAFLSDLTEKIDVGFVGSMASEYAGEGILLLQTQNVDEFFLKLENYKIINLAFHKKLKKSQVEKGNILIARSGSFGKASIYMKDEIINSSDIIIVQADESKINSFYLTAFINSKFGQNQLYRFASGGLQGHVNLTILESLKIPLPSPAFQSSIASLVQEAHTQRELSKSLYTEAEQILLGELGLIDWKPSEKNITEKMSEEVRIFGRCDADFFQPKYDDMMATVSSWTTKELDTLFDVFGGKSYKYTGGNDIIRVIKTKNLRLDEVDLEGVEDFISEEEASKTKVQFVLKRDILFASMGVGSLGRSNVYLRNESNCVVDSTLKILREKSKGIDCSSEVLNVFLQLNFTQELIYRYTVGSSGIINFYDSDLKNLPIPILHELIQISISKKITDSHIAREKSKTLLEQAKRAVEIFIEEDEESAERFLKKQI